MLFFLGDNLVLAHGVNYTINQTNALVIKVEYDDGEPMSYAEVKIFSPNDQKIEYQKGRTDKKGRFAFLPEKGGEWKVVVGDGMWHGVVANVSPGNMNVLAGNTPDAGSAVQSSGFRKWQKMVMALSIVWGFIGLAFYFHARTIRRQ
jgi:nickel transport protein